MSTIFKQLANQPDHVRYPFISYIRFPHYKNLTPDLKIEFKYPITALVGVNGSNKSSILRAIYGAPKNKSIGEYWFETNIDQIKNEKVEKSSFIYGYYNKNINRIVEVIKTRIKKDENPDYWEPSRPILQYGMEKMPSLKDVPLEVGRSLTRWNTIEKNVIFLDFRHEAISAFDRYFYVGDLKKSKTIETKQDYIRREAKHLQKIINEDKTSYSLYNKPKLKRNEVLSQSVVEKISEILGKKYSFIRIIEHSFYTSDFSKTIYVSVDNELEYSEAFAGSGEFSVISLVQSVMEAPEKSLIILDEPEVSIHPGAQEKIVEFLAEQALKKHHQIVFTTHAPAMIAQLPPEAIHVLYTNLQYTDIRSFVHPEEAFAELGAKFEKKTIIVEDNAAKLVIDKILGDNNLSDIFEVKKAPNGAEWIKKVSILECSLLNRKNVLFILDGDKRQEHRNPEYISNAEHKQLDEIIKKQTNCSINIPHPSNNEEEKINNQLKYLTYYYNYVYYFPVNDPEEILLEYSPIKISTNDSKDFFNQLSIKCFGYSNSESIWYAQQICANRMTTKEDKNCQKLLDCIQKFLSL